MEKENRILRYFKMLKTKRERAAFIIALELSGENTIANKLKEELYDV